MGDMNVLDFVKNVGRNVVTGGMYSLVKAGVDTVKTGNPSALSRRGSISGWPPLAINSPWIWAVRKQGWRSMPQEGR
jgi:hypothetical protein